MSLYINFDPHCPLTHEGEQEVTVRVLSALSDLSEKRSYFIKTMNGVEFTDEHADTRARKCFRAATYCWEHSFFEEALKWYLEGHKEFCGDSECVLQMDGCDVAIEWTSTSREFTVYVETWMNTMYGSKKMMWRVGYVMMCHAHDLSDEMLDKRQLCWDHMIAERKAIKAQNEVEMADSFKYDVIP